jgi:hypothetical protein
MRKSTINSCANPNRKRSPERIVDTTTAAPTRKERLSRVTQSE